MNFTGQFKCPLCEERFHARHKKEVFRSYFPERKMWICKWCYDDWRNAPEYAHLRPDVEPENVEEIRRQREFNKNSRIYL